MIAIPSLPARIAPALIVGLLLVPAAGSALTIRVHPDSALAADHVATMQEANALVAFGDSIEVSTAGSPYILTEEFPLVDGVVYRGGFGSDFEGPNTSLYETILQLAADSTGTVIGAGSVGAATVFAGFTVTGGNSSFQGGGMFCAGGCALEVRNCRFSKNHSDVIGGGVSIASGALPSFFNCAFDSNTASVRGGAIGIGPSAEGASIEFCTILACSTTSPTGGNAGGGAIFTASGVTLHRLTIEDCFSASNGGAIRTAPTLTGELKLHTAHLNRNTAALNGGAVYQEGGLAEYADVEFNDHQAGSNGGTFYFNGGTSVVRDCFVRDATAAVAGGAFFYDETSGSALRTTEITGNQALRGGGVAIRGLPFARSYSVEIVNNTFAFNGASEAQAGGGIHVEAGEFLDPVLNNILAYQTDGSAISCFGAFNQPNVRFNCVFNEDATNPDPEYDGDCDDRTGINGNLRAIPRFCDRSLDPPQLGLNSFSPCVGSGENGVDMGAHQGSDCADPIHVEPTSWSRIKSYYR